MVKKKLTLRLGIVTVLVMLVSIMAYIPSLTEYGVTWDEFFHRSTGEMYIRFLETGDLNEIMTNDRSAWFPPFAVTIGALFIKSTLFRALFPMDMDRFHLAAILFSVITSGFVFLIVYQLTQRYRFAVIAWIMLLVHPQFITHSHMNVRDMGLMASYTMTIYALLKIGSGRKYYVSMCIIGSLIGIASDIKQNGFFLIGIAFFWLLFQVHSIGWKKLIVSMVLLISGFLVTFILFWPYLWIDTIEHLKNAWGFLTDPSVIAGTTTFFGKIYTSGKNLPSWYPWTMIFLVTPLPNAILWIVGLVSIVYRSIIRHDRSFIIALWIAVPLFRFFIPTSAVAYDQIRHFIEVLPVIPISGALMMYWFFDRVKFRSSSVVVLMWVGFMVLFIGYSAMISVRYSPYGTAYFNRFAGNSSEINQEFDVEFWGNVYRKAAIMLNTKFPDPVTYYMPGLGTHLIKEDGLNGTITESFDSDFSYVIFMNKQNWIRERPYVMWLTNTKKPLFTIERDGKILFYLYLPFKDEYRWQTSQKKT